jgi:OFA family oxalate/formate antiporter-like MFS transporter
LSRPIPRHGKSGYFYGWYIVAASWIMLFLVNALGVGIFFKPILDEFGWDRATLSGIHTLALLLFAAVTPFLGRFIDRFGPKAMLYVTLVTQTISGTVYGLAAGLWSIFTGRFLYEIKALQSSQVLINRWFVKGRGRAQGMAATGMPIGALLLTPLSQFMILAWGWRETFFFWAGATFVIVLPLTVLVRNRPEEKGTGPDGEPLSRTAPGGPEHRAETDVPPEKVAGASGHSLAQAARLRSFWLLSGAQLICGIGCGFMMTHIVIFATDFGYPDMVAASLVSVQGGVNLVGVLLTGHISDRHPRNRVLALTHTVRSLSFFTAVAFIVLGGGALWMLYLAMALFGFGWFTTSPLTSGCVADFFGDLRMGTIIGVTMSSHTVGMAIGSYAGGLTYTLTGSYFRFFLAQGVLELLAAGLVFAIRNVKK